jgi:micrococcal nuclease
MSDQRFFYSAKVLNVVDGDTFDCMIDLGFSVHMSARVRLYGINTPESRTKDLKEKEMGLKAKEFTKDWLTRHQTVYIRTVVDKNEKYGRVLAEVYSSPNTTDPTTARLNTDIIQAGYAREYFGVGDKTWAEFKSK